jgi:hypothetical protein
VSEIWSLEDGQWTRDPVSGRFSVQTFRRLGPPSPQQQPGDLAILVGARAHVPASGGPVEWFPREFSHSPQTGEQLPPPAKLSPQRWLPPYGNGTSDPTQIGFNGLRRTDTPIRVGADVTAESLPDELLPLPRAGDFHFLSGSFNLHSNSLISIEFSRGFLFAWLPRSRRWVELEPRGMRLPESSLSRESWGVCMTVGAREGALFLPSDLGLVRIELDLLALTYQTTVVSGRCVGAPAVTAGIVTVPIVEPNGDARLLAVPETDLSRAERLPIDPPRAAGPYQLPLSDRATAIWLSGAGILSYQPASAGAPHQCSFRQWPADMTPEFQFGCPYLSSTGRLWQLCLHQREERFAYVQIRRTEIHSVSGPRLCTGQVTYHLETQSRIDPWLDTGTEDAQMKAVVLPILESVGTGSSAGTVMCLRVEFVGSLAELFASREPQAIHLELAGAQKVQQLGFARVTAPWLGSVFVHDGFAYFYHPDLQDRIPGWKLAPP